MRSPHTSVWLKIWYVLVTALLSNQSWADEETYEIDMSVAKNFDVKRIRIWNNNENTFSTWTVTGKTVWNRKDVNGTYHVYMDSVSGSLNCNSKDKVDKLKNAEGTGKEDDTQSPSTGSVLLLVGSAVLLAMCAITCVCVLVRRKNRVKQRNLHPYNDLKCNDENKGGLEVPSLTPVKQRKLHPYIDLKWKCNDEDKGALEVSSLTPSDTLFGVPSIIPFSDADLVAPRPQDQNSSY